MSMEKSLAELQRNGFCVLRQHFAAQLIHACREAFWPTLLRYLEAHRDVPNRGPNRHFLPMPTEPPCFLPEFFFDSEVLAIARGAMDETIIADQWGCDTPLQGSTYQGLHVDYKRPLFAEVPDLALPTYALVVSFSLNDIAVANGPIEIAPGTQRMPREEAMRAVELSQIQLQPVPLNVGDVLIRHPWALHRGTPNKTSIPRALLTIRYVRRWYADDSREVHPIPQRVWLSLTAQQRSMMRFSILNS